MSVDPTAISEACARLRGGEQPAAVARYLAQRGAEMLDVSRVLKSCGLSLSQAKAAIDASGMWPLRAHEEADLFDRLAEWDPGEEET